MRLPYDTPDNVIVATEEGYTFETGGDLCTRSVEA